MSRFHIYMEIVSAKGISLKYNTTIGLKSSWSGMYGWLVGVRVRWVEVIEKMYAYSMALAVALAAMVVTAVMAAKQIMAIWVFD